MHLDFPKKKVEKNSHIAVEKVESIRRVSGQFALCLVFGSSDSIGRIGDGDGGVFGVQGRKTPHRSTQLLSA